MFMDYLYKDTAEALGEWQKILDYLVPGFGTDGLMDEVWELARCNVEMPHFGNLCQVVILERLTSVIAERWPNWDTEYSVNSVASYFSINGVDIIEFWQFVELMESETVLAA